MMRNLGISFVLTLALLWGAGCASTPRAISANHPSEAKVIVEADGSLWVDGQLTKIEDFGDLIRDEDIKPSEMIFVLFKTDPESARNRRIQQALTAQFIKARHAKFFFISTLRATVITTDKRTGKSQTQIDEQEVRVLKGKEIEEEVKRIAAEEQAIKDGTYVSPAIEAAKNAKPTEENAPQWLNAEEEMRRDFQRQQRRRQLRQN